MVDCCLQLFRVCHLANTMIFSILLCWHDWYIIIGSILALYITATCLLRIPFLLLIWGYIYLFIIIIITTIIISSMNMHLNFKFLLICWLTADFFFTGICLLPQHNLFFYYLIWFCLMMWCFSININPGLSSNCSSPTMGTSRPLAVWLCWFYIAKSMRYFTYCSH